MKKIVSIILVIILAFNLCGCISCNCNCGCGEKEPIEEKQEMLTSNTGVSDINMDPNAWAGFDRDPYLG